MSFALAKARVKADRFFLVRVTPARYVGDDLESQGSGIYSMTFSQPIAKIQRNGQDLTEVSAAPSSNDQWYHDESTGALQIKLAAAPDEDDNVVCVFYHLFFARGEDREAHEDPADPETPMRVWEARLSDDPRVSQSFDNITAGVFSIADNSFEIINTDNWIQGFLTDDDSWAGKDVMMWVCIDDVANIVPAYKGRVVGFPNVDGKAATISCYDVFEAFNQPCLMGDTADEAYWIKQAGSFPNMFSRDSGTPIKYLLAKTSRWKEATASTLDPNGNLFRSVDRDFLERAVCTNYNSNISTSVNREWGICRFGPSGPRSLAFGTISSIHQIKESGLGLFVSVLYVKVTGEHNLRVGDTFKITRSFPTPLQAYVMVIEDRPFTFNPGSGTQTYQYALFHMGTGSGSDVTTDWTFHSHNAPALFVKESGKDYVVPLHYERDYSVTTVTTSSGNKYQKVTLGNDFTGEPSNGNVDGLDPAVHEILWRHGAADDLGHGAVLKRIVEQVGIDVDDASFAAADAALPAEVAFSIPKFDEQDFGSYLEYAQEILKSTLGYLALNDSFEAEYHLLAAPGDTTDQVEDDSMLGDGAKVSIDYQDLVTQLIAYNPHAPMEENSSATAVSAKAEYLHGIKRSSRFPHVLADITGRIDVLLAVRAHRKATYRLTTAVDHLDSSLGDDLTLRSGMVLGTSGQVKLKITSLDKRADQVDIEATDLLGL